MSRDISVTVTRDSRVSHATTTTPHHTYLSVAVVLLGKSRIRNNLPRRPRLGFGLDR